MILLSVTSTIPTIAPSLGYFERHIPLVPLSLRECAAR